MTLRAPINGVVTKKMAILGQFVKEGTEMYTINDLSHVWIKLDAYETDLPVDQVRPGRVPSPLRQSPDENSRVRSCSWILCSI